MPSISIIFLSTFVFTGLILLLIVLLSFVESKVAKQGDCRIDINSKEKSLVVSSGRSLLLTLADNKIFLPSACGGGGTCAMCKCQILKGAGEILPTETPFISRKEQKQNIRLACQVKVKEDLEIVVPPEIFNIKQYLCAVRSNKNVATFIKELVLEMPKNQSLDFQPGGYIQINVPPYKCRFKDFDVGEKYRADWDYYRLWDLAVESDEPVFRAYSMANYPQEQGKIILNVRIATPPPDKKSVPPGIASSYIFNLKEGQMVMISGPYGEFHIKDSKREMIYIGGGAGMAPLRSHLFDLFKARKTERKVSFWYGARSKKEIFYEDEFKQMEKDHKNFEFTIALSAPLEEDHWTGKTGFIHQVVLDEYLRNHSCPEDVEYYLCGPPMMIEAVQKMLDSLGVPPEMIAFDSFG